ncbi:MAG: amino acid adenylation domain-containing protein [Aphanothece sp. CMT-3BRIN-NPC111]|jgi:aspartate racemase|nr:amino acid adenylation domain-containing protein [Aphanothece sp. CMT-3BRIN-NPC111]
MSNQIDKLAHKLLSLSPAQQALIKAALQQSGKTGKERTQTIPKRTETETERYSITLSDSWGKVANQPAWYLSLAQERLWFIEQLEGASAINNISRVLKLEGELDVTALEQAVQNIINRHETLRTTFHSINGKPVQVIQEPPKFQLPLIDLSLLPLCRQSEEVQRQLQLEAQLPFNLASDLMLLMTLFRLSEREHVLLFVMHHIVGDGWSLGIFSRELSQLYAAFLRGASSPLLALPIQFVDFAIWQRQLLQREALQPQLSYWKQQLSGSLPVLNIPTDRPRPPIQTHRGAQYPLILSQPLTIKLKQLSQQSATTLFMTLLAAFKVLLYRYTNQEDIIIGSPIAGRNQPEVEGLIGFFINNLVLRTNLSGNPSFTELLGRVRQTALDAYSHQDVPYAKLVEEIGLARDLSQSPLFQVMFGFQNTPNAVLELPGLALSGYPHGVTKSELLLSSYKLAFDDSQAKFDLSVLLKEEDGMVEGTIEYNTDLFEQNTIARLVGHFQTLVEGIVTDPDQPISNLPWLTPVEQKLLVEWNQTQTEYFQHKCIHQLFEEQVERTPDAVAVIFENQQLTYQQLNKKANQLAHYLHNLGIKPEALVGIYVERSLEMVVGLLGILKAGGAYVPLDPAYPKERLQFMLSDTQIKILVTQERFLNQIPEPSINLVCLDTDQAIIAQFSEQNLATKVMAENLAYVMYTSGSTGTSKGVSVVHRGVVRLVKNTNYARLSAAEVFLQLAPISFDASTWEIWGCLLNGAKLVVMPPSQPSLAELGAAIKQYQVTTLWLTAGLFHLMVDERLEDLKPLRQLLAGGDVLSVAHVQKFRQNLPGCQLINGYGPTENTTFTCCYLINADSQLKNSVSIGRPISNSEVYILDCHLQPVAIGIPGELYIGGSGLARGYFNRPDLTKEKFIPNPFSDEPNSRLYKSGDLVRYLPDGNIEFLGRLNNQVKIRGFRIELGEIEATLRQHPDVREAVVVAREDIPGDKRLVAYIVLISPSILVDHYAKLPSELRGLLQTKLPVYMMPSNFVLLDVLPLTPNGKVNLRALPAPEVNSQVQENKLVAPRNDLKVKLTIIWENILGIKPIGVRDNFFELGGHSLLTIRMVAEIEKAFGRKIPITALFQLTTIEEITLAFQEEPKYRGKKYPQEEVISSWSEKYPQLSLEDYRTLLAVVAGRLGDRPRPDSLMVALNSNGVKPPLFYCANGFHEVASVAEHLGESQPIYLLESGYILQKFTEQDVKAIASYHVNDILTVQPQEPYLLVGYSWGCSVAFEIAQQLQAKRKKVELLVLLDRPGNGSHPLYKFYKKYIESIFKIYYYQLSNLSVLSWKDKLVYISAKVNKIYKKYQNSKGFIPKQNTTKAESSIFSTGSNTKLPRQPYLGRVALFLASDTPFYIKLSHFLFPRAGWDKGTVNDLEIYRVPGNHISMLQQPHLQVLVEKLKACIDTDFQ